MTENTKLTSELYAHFVELILAASAGDIERTDRAFLNFDRYCVEHNMFGPDSSDERRLALYKEGKERYGVKHTIYQILDAAFGREICLLMSMRALQDCQQAQQADKLN